MNPTDTSTRDILDIETDLVAALKMVYDPEIPASVYDLGLIYDIDVQEDRSVHIVMSLTTPNCPIADLVIQDVQQAAESVLGVTKAQVELTFDPPWSEERMNDEARFQLGML